jgi:hypothetical protein
MDYSMFYNTQHEKLRPGHVQEKVVRDSRGGNRRSRGAIENF